MKRLLLFFISLSSLLSSTAQVNVSGIILDEESTPLYGATAMLLDGQDSTMVSFAVSNDSGKFQLEDIDTGNYVLQLNYVGYADFFKNIEVLDKKKAIDCGQLVMLVSSELLNEVTIEAEHIPMGILGDTISYNASAFKMREGSNVEDLLKKLPGIEVDRAGRIKAQGEDVENVLVDGKEFFGNDPLVATRNLEAEAVDKVEVFDKKSEIAEFTGIEDGQDEKTINLKLKEDHKNGGFGSITASAGTEETWLGKLNYNRFSPTMQASVIASANNINEQAFSLNDYISFMGGFANAIAASGAGGYDFSGGFGNNRQANRGIAENYSIGTNLNYDIGSKLQLFSNYFYSEVDNQLDEQQKASNFSLDNTFTNRDTILRLTNDKNHRFNSKWIYKLNPLNVFVLKANFQGIFNDRTENTNSRVESLGELISLSNRNNSLKKTQFALESSLQYKRKFLKKGRNWISSANYKFANFDEDEDVQNDFESLTTQDIIDQSQQYQNQRKEFHITSDYTEPIGKKLFLGISYGYFANQENPRKDFFDISGQNLILNEGLSSLYQKDFSYHELGVSLRRNRKKLKMSFGLTAQRTSLDGVINENENRIDKRFTHLLPNISLDFNLARSSSMNINYSTNITAPSLSQLMPLPNNVDPNFFVIGNPDLEPEYNHSLTWSYNTFDQFDNSSFFAFVNVNFVKNRIMNRISFTEDLRRELLPINTDFFMAVNGSVSFRKPIRALGIFTNVRANIGFSNYDNFIDGVKNRVGDNNLGLNLSVSNKKKKYVDASVGLRLNYTIRDYSVNSAFNQQFFNYDWFVEGDVFLTKSTAVTLSFDHRRYSGEFFSEMRSFNILNIEFTQTLKNNRWTLFFKGNDLLKQNIGFDRFGTVNSLQESQYNALSRYFMLGARYKISSKPKGGIEVQFDE